MKIINIDNGGTLTDFCVIDDALVHHAKVLTTPYDLSKCFFDGIARVSEQVYGTKDPARLMRETDYVRYSTTQGTNAIVERRGPRLGIVTDLGGDALARNAGGDAAGLFEAFVGDRVAIVDTGEADEACETSIVRAVNEVAARGAMRVVIALTKDDFAVQEKRLFRLAQRHFPSHLLGAIPLATASGLTDEPEAAVRIWTALFNAYLHPSMERFLYSADHRLKSHKCSNPLLIFRNDGGTARVAKTVAFKTYSSGPRAGMEAVRALAQHYGYAKTVSYDVGGTTTDIGVVEGYRIQTRERGQVEGIPVAMPLADIESAGVGGSSVISIEDGAIKVGPQSVGAAPGPACFGFGGQEVTITDVAFLSGLLSRETFFGGQLEIDVERARDVVMTRIANPLGIGLDEAIVRVFAAWTNRISTVIEAFARPDPTVTYVAFGGAGALVATRLADVAGVRRVIIPRLASVFSACGIGFSDLSHDYRQKWPAGDAARRALMAEVLERARGDMFGEGVDLADCKVLWQVVQDEGLATEGSIEVLGNAFPEALVARDGKSLHLKAVKEIQHLSFAPVGNEARHEARTSGHRRTLLGTGEWREIPVYKLEDQTPGASASGPAIVEEAYFTGCVDAGWSFMVSANGDVVLEKI